MNKELKGYLLGNATPNLWYAALIAAGFMALMMIIYRVSRRDKESPRTPVKFNLWFFFKDTGLRMIATTGFIFILIRLLFIWKVETGWVIGISILFGLLSDRLGKIFQRAGDKGEQLVNDKMDEIIDELHNQKAKINVVKADVSEIKDDVKDIKNEQ
jgi:hypothetical protein